MERGSILGSKLRPHAVDLWPYGAFLVLVAAYNYFFLGDGFNGTDEGYLLSLGKRVAEGQRPYLDFYFLRTPLSIYIQAGLIRLFGDGYTILASRVFWVIEMSVLTIALSAIYRRFISRLELFLLLTTTYVILSLSVSFPWYSSDAMLFAGIAIVLHYKKRFLLAGLAIGLAFMTKQGYGLMAPLFVGIAGFINYRFPDLKLINWRIAIKLLSGAALPALIYITYMASNGGAGRFIRNVLLMPTESSGVGLAFAVFQNNHVALAYSAPLIVSVLIFFLIPRRRKIGLAIGSLSLAAALYIMMLGNLPFTYNLVMLNYTLGIVGLTIIARGRSSEVRDFSSDLTPPMIMALTAQYLSGFNYTGLAFAYVGAGTAIGFSYLLFSKTLPGRSRTAISIAAILILLGAATYQKHKAIYRDEKRENLTASFQTAKLRGIRSNERNVRQIDGIVKAAEEYTNKGDDIYIFPDFPVLYYLTDRNNPTPVDWPFFREINREIIIEALDSLKSRLPKVVFLQQYSESDYLRRGDKFEFYGYTEYRPFIQFFYSRYRLLKEIGDIFILTPI
jgi:hypothetical protein